MRLRWVPRCTYDELRSEYRDQLAQWQASYRDLLTKYHQLKLQGATLVEPVAQQPKPPVDLVEQAIQRSCAGRPELIPVMRRQAMRDKMGQLSEQEIVLRIQHGVRPAQWMDDANDTVDPTIESQADAS